MAAITGKTKKNNKSINCVPSFWALEFSCLHLELVAWNLPQTNHSQGSSMLPQIPFFHHLHSHHLLHSYLFQPQPARTRATRIKINQSIKLINEQNYFSVTWSRFSFFLSFLLTDLVLGRASASGSYPGGPAEPISFFSCTGRGKRSEKRRRVERKKKREKNKIRKRTRAGLGW